MARLRDISLAIRSVGPLTLCKRVWQQVGEDDVFTLGAAMAYSWLFAVFPFLVFLISLVPLVPERFKPNVKEDVSHFLDKTVPEEVAKVVMRPVEDVLSKPSAGGFLSFGLLFAMWAASGGMNMTMFAMDKAYDVEIRRPVFKQRLLALGLTVVVAALLILLMILMPVGTIVLTWLLHLRPEFSHLYILVNVARYAIALVLMFTILAVAYHFGPNFPQKFVAITPGAVFTITVWLILGYAFRTYLTSFGGVAKYNQTYGAVAGAAILLLVFYIDSLVLLIGAEINSEIDFAIGQGPRHR
jgi:membrane protein